MNISEKDARRLNERLRKVKIFLEAISWTANGSDDSLSFTVEPLADIALEDLRASRKIVKRLVKAIPVAGSALPTG